MYNFSSCSSPQSIELHFWRLLWVKAAFKKKFQLDKCNAPVFMVRNSNLKLGQEWILSEIFFFNSKLIKPVNPKENQPWILTGRTDAEASILRPPDSKSRLTGKDPDAGKDWGQEEKGTTEDEMVGWHHRLDGHELGQKPGDSEGQGSLVCGSPWGCKESETT